MNSANLINCKECKKGFSHKKSLYRHKRQFHDSDNGKLKNKLYCSSSSIYLEHNYFRNSKRSFRIICPEETCPEKLLSYKFLLDHLTNHHAFQGEFESIKFSNLEEFQKWKHQMEIETLSRYTMDTSDKKISNGSSVQYFNCHRSFTYKPKGRGYRRLKSMGSQKFGKTCPSRIIVNISKNQIEVKFWKTHYGHGFQLGHLKFDKLLKNEIAGQLKEGINFQHILDSIQDNKANQLNENHRLNLIERKDLHNIVRDYNIEYETKRHQDDAISVKLWVKEMISLQEKCPVLFYKGQGEESTDINFKDNDFVLIIMTQFQSMQMKNFGTNKICIDGTHGTNPYDIHLFTLMTVDEFGSGCPVAFCFSNRLDEYIFKLYFSTIKNKIGIISSEVFMSDDAPAFYNAWASVMGAVDHKLLCSWHVDKNWRSNLSKVEGGCEKKTLVYKALRTLLQLTDISDFHVCMDSFIKQLKDDEQTKIFGNYFEIHYSNRPEAWAYCYRRGLGINTNMYLEAFHKTLKYIYLQGKKIKRLDKTINAVMKVARDAVSKDSSCYVKINQLKEYKR